MAQEALADTAELDITAPTNLLGFARESQETDIPVLKAVVQSGDIDLINSVRNAKRSPVSEAPTEQHADSQNLSATPNDLTGMICESDLEATIDAIVEEHIKSIRAELKAVLALHLGSHRSD